MTNLNKIQNALIFTTTLLASSFTFALNSSGYVKIQELKAWQDKYDVYLLGSQKHTCSNQVHSTRFLVKTNDEALLPSIMMAFAAQHNIRISYNCDASGNPIISGIRMRP